MLTRWSNLSRALTPVLFVLTTFAFTTACSPGPPEHVEVDRPPELFSGQPFYNQIKAGTDDAQDWFVIYAETEMTVALNIRLDKKEDLVGSIQVVSGNGEELYKSVILAVGNIPGTLTLERGPWYVKIEAEQGYLEYTIMMTVPAEE